MTKRLAPIRICRCQYTRVTNSENGRVIRSIASRWPAASAHSADKRARGLFSIIPAETASGHPIPGFTPW